MSEITKFTFENEDHTLGALLRKEILKDSVEFAGYKKVHPLKRMVELTVVSNDPEQSLQNAKKSIQKDIKKLKKGFNAELSQTKNF